MTAAPSDVAGWRSSPAGLNGQTLGKNVRLSDGGCVAERGEGGLENAVVYTDNAIPVGQVWLVTVLATSRAGSREGLVSVQYGRSVRCTTLYCVALVSRHSNKLYTCLQNIIINK